jgi:hypothetical protein
MNFADLQDTWNSAHNRPSAAECEAQKARFVRTLERKRRGFFAFLALPVAVLLVVTALVNWRAFGPSGATAGEEWAGPLLLLLPWTAVFVFIRHQIAHVRGHADYRASIPASLRALLDENRRAWLRATTILWIHVASVPVLVLAIRQLEEAGKLRPHELRSMAVFFGGVIVASIVGLLIVRARKLRPERERLAALLREYEEAGAESR